MVSSMALKYSLFLSPIGKPHKNTLCALIVGDTSMDLCLLDSTQARETFHTILVNGYSNVYFVPFSLLLHCPFFLFPFSQGMQVWGAMKKVGKYIVENIFN